MKFDPPLLTEGPLSGAVYVVTHGKVEPHPTREGESMVTASAKYDVTDQFEALAARRNGAAVERVAAKLAEMNCPSPGALPWAEIRELDRQGWRSRARVVLQAAADPETQGELNG